MSHSKILFKKYFFIFLFSIGIYLVASFLPLKEVNAVVYGENRVSYSVNDVVYDEIISPFDIGIHHYFLPNNGYLNIKLYYNLKRPSDFTSIYSLYLGIFLVLVSSIYFVIDFRKTNNENISNISKIIDYNAINKKYKLLFYSSIAIPVLLFALFFCLIKIKRQNKRFRQRFRNIYIE